MANIRYRGSAVPTDVNVAGGKNAALSNIEIDQNFFALDRDKLDKSSAYSSTVQTVAGPVTFSNNIVISGNLEVNVTTTTINSTTLAIDDKNIVLGDVATPTNVTADGGGITLKGATDKTLNWVNADSAWTSSEHVKLAAGKNVVLSGATSGTVTLATAAVAGTTTITFPATTGTVVTTGDSGTVTNAMLAGSIANGKLANSAVTVGTTAISLGSASTTLAGLTSVTSTSFVGDVTGTVSGNAGTATKLATARAINGVNFDGSAGITITANTPNALALKFDTGSTEGTDLYTFNGNAAKTVDIKAGTNVTITKAAGVITIASSNPGGTVTSVTGTAPIAVSNGTTTPAISISAATQAAAGSMSATDKAKLDGIAVGANNYVLPLAADGTRGGVQIGFATDAPNRNYAVQLSSEKMYVNVPWTVDTNTTYSIKASAQTNGAGLDLDAGGSGSGTDTVKILGSSGTTVTRTDADTITISSTSVGDGTLSIAAKTAGATNTDVTLNLSGAYSANTTTNRTINAVVGPALTNLATLMTSGNTGFIKRTGADTYSIDTNTYLTSYTESSNLTAVTNRGATTNVNITYANNANAYFDSITGPLNPPTTYTASRILFNGFGVTDATGEYYSILSQTSGNALSAIRMGHASRVGRIEFGNMAYWTGATQSYGNGTYPIVMRAASSNGTSAILEVTSGDMRSPVFYEYNNTSYYLDLASTGTSLATRGSIVTGGASGAGDGLIEIHGASGSSGHAFFGQTHKMTISPPRSIGTNTGEYAIFDITTPWTSSLGYYFRVGNSNILTMTGGGRFVFRDMSATTEGDGRKFSLLPPQYVSNINTTYSTILDAGTETNGFNPGFRFTKNTNFNGAVAASDILMEVTSAGNFTASGNVTAYSDVRLKTNIKTLENSLEKTLKLRGVSFQKDGKDSIGVIAQEIREVLPEVVLEGDDKEKTLSVAYGNIVGVLIEAIKELNAKVEDLQKQLSNK